VAVGSKSGSAVGVTDQPPSDMTEQKMSRLQRRALAEANKRGRLWDSSDEDSSSDEDFKFLDAIANGKQNMTEMEAKLI